MHSLKVSGIGVVALACLAMIIAPARSQSPETKLAITNAIVQRSEDGPPVPASYKFLPGEFIYFTFQIAGFSKSPATSTSGSKIGLTYSISPIDSAEVILAPSAEDKVNAELNAEDKDWTPKRRVSFQLPSFAAAGSYRLRVKVQDDVGQAVVSKDYPFQIGGDVILPSESAGVQAFRFFRHKDDRESLDLPAYAVGDIVFARFLITGFKKAEENRYRLLYRVTVLRPDGKAFLRDTPDIELDSKTFYPAPYLPAEIDLTTSKDSAKGQYRLTVTVRDQIAKTSSDFTTEFNIE